MFGSIFDSAISGVIPAVGVVVGGAVVKALFDRRRDREETAASKLSENKTLEERVSELTEVLGGTKATRFKEAEPGIVKRFDTLESKVDTHGVLLVSIQAGIVKLAKGQETAATIAANGHDK